MWYFREPELWNPHLAKDIKWIEGVQQRDTKLIHDVTHLSYDDRLQRLGLTRLNRRRDRWLNWSLQDY